MKQVQVEVKFDDVKRRVDFAFREGLLEAAILLRGQAVEYADFKKGYQTGNLRGSIKYEIVNNERDAIVGTEVEYAPHVEYGTTRQEAQPFLRPAFDDTKPLIEAILGKELNKVLED